MLLPIFILAYNTWITHFDIILKLNETTDLTAPIPSFHVSIPLDNEEGMEYFLWLRISTKFLEDFISRLYIIRHYDVYSTQVPYFHGIKNQNMHIM